MLEIVVPEREYWDPIKEEFIKTKRTTLRLEHSLLSVSKWESKWKVPFLTKESKTLEQTIDYIRCMTLTQNVDPIVYYNLPADAIDKIKSYMDDTMTATRINNTNGKRSREIITSELIYYWMLALQIPFDPCEKWHLNRLMTLIEVTGIKNQPPKKMSKKQTMQSNAAINAARRAKLGSSG